VSIFYAAFLYISYDIWYILGYTMLGSVSGAPILCETAGGLIPAPRGLFGNIP